MQAAYSDEKGKRPARPFQQSIDTLQGFIR